MSISGYSGSKVREVALGRMTAELEADTTGDMENCRFRWILGRYSSVVWRCGASAYRYKAFGKAFRIVFSHGKVADVR